MTSTTAKYRALIETLYDQTRSKKLKWKWESDDRSVWMRLAGQTLSIEMSSNSDFEPLCALKIENSQGEYLDGFNDENLGPEKPKVGSFVNWYLIMEEIYAMAKRQATGADEALDNILRELHASDDFDDIDI